jgi:hypothetical protein
MQNKEVKKQISAGAFSIFVDAQRTLYLLPLLDYLCGTGVPTLALIDVKSDRGVRAQSEQKRLVFI